MNKCKKIFCMWHMNYFLFIFANKSNQDFQKMYIWSIGIHKSLGIWTIISIDFCQITERMANVFSTLKNLLFLYVRFIQETPETTVTLKSIKEIYCVYPFYHFELSILNDEGSVTFLRTVNFWHLHFLDSKWMGSREASMSMVQYKRRSPSIFKHCKRTFLFLICCH